MRALILTLCIGGAVGCSVVTPPPKTYEGPDRPAAELATIVGDSKLPMGKMMVKKWILISCIDGQSTERHLAAAMVRFPDHVSVLPGRHYVRGWYSEGRLSSQMPMWLDAEAGQTYKINVGPDLRMWITNSATGLVVGGIPGGEANPLPPEKICR